MRNYEIENEMYRRAVELIEKMKVVVLYEVVRRQLNLSLAEIQG